MPAARAHCEPPVSADWRWAAAIGAGALVYFAGAALLTLEWSDEGHLVHFIWRVSQGAVPYRDFQHIYGPSVFYLNALLLQVFGTDLLVIRAGLVIVKTAIVVGLYLLARAVVPRGYAAAIAAVVTLIVGMPLWVFHTPYASHYALACTVWGLVAVAYARHRLLSACGMAGLLFGLAATFKLTSGVFALLGFGLAVLAEAASRSAQTTSVRSALWPRLVHALFLLAGWVLVPTYLAGRTPPLNALLIGAPMLALLVWRTTEEARAPRDPSALAARALLVSGTAFALPLAFYGVWFGVHGQAGALIANLLVLPQGLDWVAPLALLDARNAAAAGGLVALLGAAYWLDGRIAPRTGAAVGWSAAALATGTLAVLVTAGLAATRVHGWLGWVAANLFIMAPVLFTGGGVFVLLTGRGLPRDEGRRRGLTLLTVLAAASLLALSPLGDLPHLLFVLPAFVPIAGAVAWSIMSARPSIGRATGSLVVALALIVAANEICRITLVAVAWANSPSRLARATLVRDLRREGPAAAHVVEYLASHPDGRPLLVTSGGQLFNFLTARPSPVDGELFMHYYLVDLAFFPDGVARARLSDQQLAARLSAVRPWVVDTPASIMAKRFELAYPATAALLRARYQPVFTDGPYRVLAWAAEAEAGAPAAR